MQLTLSQFMCEHRRVHWVAAKHILRYLQGTVDCGLYYRQGDGVRLARYTVKSAQPTVSIKHLHIPFSKTEIFLGGAAPQTFRWEAWPPPRPLAPRGQAAAGRSRAAARADLAIV